MDEELGSLFVNFFKSGFKQILHDYLQLANKILVKDEDKHSDRNFTLINIKGHQVNQLYVKLSQKILALDDFMKNNIKLLHQIAVEILICYQDVLDKNLNKGDDDDTMEKIAVTASDILIFCILVKQKLEANLRTETVMKLFVGFNEDTTNVFLYIINAATGLKKDTVSGYEDIIKIYKQAGVYDGQANIYYQKKNNSGDPILFGFRRRLDKERTVGFVKRTIENYEHYNGLNVNDINDSGEEEECQNYPSKLQEMKEAYDIHVLENICETLHCIYDEPKKEAVLGSKHQAKNMVVMEENKIQSINQHFKE